MTLMQKRALGLVGLATVACAAAAGVYISDARQASQSEKSAAADKLLSFANPDEVVAAVLLTPHGTFNLQRSGPGENAWSLTEPMHTPAEASTVEAMVQAALDLQPGVTLGKDPNQPPLDLSLFGLQPPHYALTLRNQAGESQTLAVGKQNSYNNSLYVQRQGRPQVASVPSQFTYQLDKDLYKLREKRPILVGSDDITRVVVQAAHGDSYTLERRGPGYVLTAPLATGADETQASGVFGALSGLRAKSFVTEDGQSPAKRKLFGLAAPALQAQLTLKDGSQPTLLLGQLELAGQTPHYFMVRDGPNQPIMELGSDWAFKKLGVALKDLRDMHVLRFDRTQVQTMSLRRFGKDPASLNFVKEHDAGAGVDVWKMASAQKAVAQSSKVAALMVKLGNLRAESVVQEKAMPADLAAKGLHPPAMQIDLAGADGQILASLHMGAVTGNMRYVTEAAQTRIDQVHKSSVDDISFHPADYQEEPAAAQSN